MNLAWEGATKYTRYTHTQTYIYKSINQYIIKYIYIVRAEVALDGLGAAALEDGPARCAWKVEWVRLRG